MRKKPSPFPKLSAGLLGLGLKTVIFFAVEVQMDILLKFQFKSLRFIDLQ